MFTMELDWRTGEPYIDPTGTCKMLDDDSTAFQNIRNTLGTYKGSDSDALDHGVDWLYIFRLPGSLDPVPYLTMEISSALVPQKVPQVSHVSGIAVDDDFVEERRIYKVSLNIVLTNGKSLPITQMVTPQWSS